MIVLRSPLITESQAKRYEGEGCEAALISLSVPVFSYRFTESDRCLRHQAHYGTTIILGTYSKRSDWYILTRNSFTAPSSELTVSDVAPPQLVC
jgi:hypothetical protein